MFCVCWVRSHRKQQTHLRTRDSEPMLIRGRSPAIVGGSTAKQHRPFYVPAGSRITRLPSKRTRCIKPPSTHQHINASMHRAGRAASADRMMAVSQHQANTGLITTVKYTTLHFLHDNSYQRITVTINVKQNLRLIHDSTFQTKHTPYFSSRKPRIPYA